MTINSRYVRQSSRRWGCILNLQFSRTGESYHFFIVSKLRNCPQSIFYFQVCQLTEEQTQHLVKMTRDFSLLFYRVRPSAFQLWKMSTVSLAILPEMVRQNMAT